MYIQNKFFKWLVLPFTILLMSATLWTGVLNDIPDQIVDPNVYNPINLNTYLQSGTTCNTLTITPVLPIGTATQPACTTTDVYGENMTLTLQVSFSSAYKFSNANDYLLAYDNLGNVVGCASPLNVPGINGSLYFLTVLGDFAEYPVDLQFYSEDFKTVFDLPNAFTYVRNQITGTVDMPYQLELHPLLLLTPNTDVVAPALLDPSWEETQCYTFEVSDCTPAGTGTDQVCFTGGVLPACPMHIDILTTITGDATFHAAQTIRANSKVNTGTVVRYQAGESMLMEAGFEVEAGADFEATIAPCGL